MVPPLMSPLFFIGLSTHLGVTDVDFTGEVVVGWVFCLFVCLLVMKHDISPVSNGNHVFCPRISITVSGLRGLESYVPALALSAPCFSEGWPSE